MRLAALLFLATTALASPAFAQGYDSGWAAEQSTEAKKFQASIMKTAAEGYTSLEIKEGFLQNGWAMSEGTIDAIAGGAMTAQEAIDASLIVPATPQQQAGVAQNQYQAQTQYQGYSGGGDSYEGGSMDIASVPGNVCAGGQAAAVGMTAAGGISSWFTGGRSTALLQMAQLVKDDVQSMCLLSQLQTQLKMLWTQVQNLKYADLTTVNGTLSALYGVRSILGQVDATTYQMNRVSVVLNENYPETYAGMTDADVLHQYATWQESTRKATEESWKIQAEVVRNKQAVELRMSQQVAALNNAPGALAAQQATGNLITTMIEQAEHMQSATVAHYRVIEHEVMKEQAERENAEELHNRRSLDWGNADGMAVSPLFGQ